MVLEEKTVEAGGGEEEEAEYESDPEEVSLSLVMRRREASDDDDDEEDERDGERENDRSRTDPRVGRVGSDSESDGQGAAAVYDDDDEESEIDEEEEEEEFEERGSDGGENEAGGVQVQVAEEIDGDGARSNGEQRETDGKDVVEGEKKENEPFAVPTAGAFYMHDDRFRDNGGGRNRRTPGGRKLWESKDVRRWGHDKFEELKLQENHYEKERRNSKGRFRGHGRGRGIDRGGGRGNRPRAYDDRNNQNQTIKSVRGRGPRRYEPATRNNRETLTTKNKQPGKPVDSTSQDRSGRILTNSQASNVHSDPAPPRKNVFASSLSSASPPFYPSGTSNQDVPVNLKKDLPIGNINKNPSPPIMVEDRYPAHSRALVRGKTTADSVGQEGHYVDESIRPVIGKFTNMHLQSPGASPISPTQSPQNQPKGRGSAGPGHAYQLAPSFDNVSRLPQQTQLAVHQRPAQNTVQLSVRASQQMGAGSRSWASSPPKVSPSSSEPGELDSPPGSAKSKTAVVVKGKTGVQGSGRADFLYSGAQGMGAVGGMGVAHGDQKFPGTPALLPFMQFGGQHPGGLGVPAVGMALPGYVAQPGPNNEMTWVPFLAGAAGALGATYCPPYLTMDGGYYSRPTGQTSSLGSSSKETSMNKSNAALKPPQRPELVNDEFGQRQNKPRRYSTMSFGQ